MAAHLPPTGSVWAVSDTANKAVTFGVGLLQAATSDDISPLAVACCEQFGSCLPISTFAKHEVELLARRDHTSHVLNYVKASIGYRKDDSVDQMSRSDSGIRFLCLAATLCTLDHYDAADRLDAMLQASQEGMKLRPTLKQLQAMMGPIRRKLSLTTFATSIADFEIMLRGPLSDCGDGYGILIAQVPNKASLLQLVKILNDIGRIGEERSFDALEVVLRPSHVPWTCAFIKWILGVPPRIETSDHKVLLPLQNSLVTLTVRPITMALGNRKRQFDDMESDLKLVPVTKIGNLRQLLFSETEQSKVWAWKGLINARTWVRYHLSIFFQRFPIVRQQPSLLDAVSKALHFIVAELPEHLILCEDFSGLHRCLIAAKAEASKLMHPAAPSPFPEAHLRLGAAQNLVDGQIQLVETRDVDRSAKTLFPSSLARVLSRTCRSCSNDSSNGHFAGQVPCDVNDFLEQIGLIGAMLLTFSLFGSDETHYPMVNGGLEFATSKWHNPLIPRKVKQIGLWRNSWTMLVTQGWQPLMYKAIDVLYCPPMAIFKHAAKMMGHQKILDSTIISSRGGQVLFPALLDSDTFLSKGYMQLCSFPGSLMKDGMRFDVLVDEFIDSDLEEEVDDDDDVDASETNSIVDETFQLSAMQMVVESEADDIATIEIEQPDTSVNSSIDEQQDEEEVTSAMEEASPETQTQLYSPVTTLSRDYTARSRNLKESLSAIRWDVTIQDDMLRGHLYLGTSAEPEIFWQLMGSLSWCRLTTSCPHSKSRKAGEVADKFQLCQPPVELRTLLAPLAVYDLGRSFATQWSGLARQDWYPPTLVHDEGCIRCALNLCLETGSCVVLS